MSDKQDKSVLDNVPIKEDEACKAMRVRGAEVKVTTTPGMGIVGHCPHCGSPVYGPQLVFPDDSEIKTRFSCHCYRKVNPPNQTKEG